MKMWRAMIVLRSRILHWSSTERFICAQEIAFCAKSTQQQAVCCDKRVESHAKVVELTFGEGSGWNCSCAFALLKKACKHAYQLRPSKIIAKHSTSCGFDN